MATNAKLDIKIAIQIHQRIDAERFRPTVTRMSTYHYVTDFNGVSTQIPTIATAIWNDVAANRALFGVYQTDIHFGIRVDNVTHPTPALGVVPLAKAHKDTVMTHGDVVNVNAIQLFLVQLVEDVKSLSTYA